MIVNGLVPGEYLLQVDGQDVVSGNHEQWANGLPVDQSPAHKETGGAPVEDQRQEPPVHLQLESSQPSAHRGRAQEIARGAALPNEVIRFNELAILKDAEFGNPSAQDPDMETHPTMKLRHETDWLFLPILCPILLLGQGPEGISKSLANADLSLIENHDPAVEKENFNLLPGYEINLFAQEPMLANPIHMTWDTAVAFGSHAHGLTHSSNWVKWPTTRSSFSRTRTETGGPTSPVFADGLYMPTGIELANGGCFVAQTPDVFF